MASSGSAAPGTGAQRGGYLASNGVTDDPALKSSAAGSEGSTAGTPPGSSRPALLPALPARPGRRRRNLPVEERRSRILDAGRLVFSEKGYSASTMHEIATTAGVSRAWLYRLYSSRNALYHAIAEEDAKALAGEVLLEIVRATGVDAKVRSFIGVFFAFAERRRQRDRLFYSHAAHDELGLGDLMRTVRTALVDTVLQQLAVDANFLKTMEPAESRLRVHAVISMAEGAATAWMSGPQLDRERSVDIVTGVALRALRLRPTETGV